LEIQGILSLSAKKAFGDTRSSREGAAWGGGPTWLFDGVLPRWVGGRQKTIEGKQELKKGQKKDMDEVA